ncbi:Ken-052 [Symbiodinium natans]|uniref:Ken-052 protein n=1 Tax=Symbiodinium natans TaxID=878477 RepID=A0A812KAN3_9DINO|nr:Ken-052 [Symbiodinium natans]
MAGAVDLRTALAWGKKAENWVPWMWSRRVCEELGDPVAAERCAGWLALHGKEWAAARCLDWRKEFAGELERRFGLQCGGGQVVCWTEEEADDAISRTLDEGWPGVFVKAEHGWAGQGNKRLRNADTEAAQRHFRRWLARRLRQGPVVVEPAARQHLRRGTECDRVLDFSVQLDVCSTGKTEIMSKNVFRCDGRGAFLGAEVGEHDWEDAWVCAFSHNTARVSDGADACELADFTASTLAATVGRRLASAGYAGPCGVDGFLYRHPDTGLLTLRPISDVNPRQTITRVAQVVANRLPEDVLGRSVGLRLLPRARAEALWARRSEAVCSASEAFVELPAKVLDNEFGVAAPVQRATAMDSTRLRVLPLTPLGEAARPGLAALLITGVAGDETASVRAARDGRRAKAAVEVRHFAEGLLLRGSLEEKLEPPPQELLEALKGPGLGGQAVESLDIEWPQRDEDIAICRGLKGGSDQLPKMGKILSSLEARVQCLQKFANHELQAIEMFAWALLRFPEAPRGLQRGLLKTIREEQSHCRLYLDRVATLAPETPPMGAAPLSGYLWRSLAAVDSAPEPLEAFLCGVGLTFEAANLDHSLRYRDIFQQAGDDGSAAVLQRVHDEEVEHVRLAHVWLRRLAEARGLAELDDLALYERFAAKPVFALCKARGRGFPAIAARRKAGLSEAMIAAVRHAKSQRRPIAVGPAVCSSADGR